MQIIELPAAFLTQTLTNMRLSDIGDNNLQRTILEGVTIQKQPIQYIFSGFFQPIDNTQPNSANAGRTIPVKWRLTDANGAPISDPNSFISVSSSATSGGCGGT